MKLDDNVTTIKQISTSYASKLAKLEIFTLKDLLTHFPRKYIDLSKIITISEIINDPDEEAEYLIAGFLTNLTNTYIRGNRSIQRGLITDESGVIKCMWFNQPYLQRAIKAEIKYTFSGKIKVKKSNIYFYPKLFEPILQNRELVHTARIVPEYALTTGISKKWFRNKIKNLIDDLETIEIKEELFDRNIVRQSLKTSLKSIHFPKTDKDIEAAKEILSLNELVDIQFKLEEKRRNDLKNHPPIFDRNIDMAILNDFLKKLPFQLTDEQDKACNKIINDLKEGNLLNILLQGDVGSGKTIVAVIASLLANLGGYQTVVLAPTTILAEQHSKTFQSFLKNFPVKIELVTAAVKKNKDADILIGTSAVLARKQNLIKKLGLVIVDEQHRFGVKQREELLAPLKETFSKNVYPHFINMTATPIPRTIAQAAFGDVEVVTINSKPLGRKEIKTYIVPEEKREDSYKWINDKIEEGEQVYWVCPLISESEKLEIKSAEETQKKLKVIFEKRKVGLLHGKMSPKEKNEVMDDFKTEKIDILVSTSVIEVGIDVPNATVMVIESPERFGLAQLHQIRGRVGRSEKQSYCFLFLVEEQNITTKKRLDFFAKNQEGNKIAEFDLSLRGPGEVYGTRQSGLPNLKIASLTNLKLIQTSKLVAQKLYDEGERKIQLFS